MVDAEQARALAAVTRIEAQERVSAARAEAAQIISAAEAEERKLTAQATAVDRAEPRRRRAPAIWARSDAPADAEADERQADTLTAERARLGEQIGGLDARLAELGDEQGELAGQLARPVRAPASRRSPKRSPSSPPPRTRSPRLRASARPRRTRRGHRRRHRAGRLLDALTAAKAHRTEARRLLNIAHPDRPEAIRDRAVSDLLGALEGNSQRLADQAAQRPQQQRIVQL